MRIDILKAYKQERKPRDFVLPGLLSGTVGAIVSPGGAGKSMFALELAILVSTGRNLAGISGVKHRGRVAFLAAEDPPDEIEERLLNIGSHLSEAEQIESAESIALDALIGEPLDVMSKKGFEAIEAVATDRRLVFLDTLRRFHDLDENDGGAMSRVLTRFEQIARKTGCALVFLHHASKASVLSGQGDMQQASRGSSVLVDNIRWQMFVATATADEAKKILDVDESKRGFYVRCGISKRNSGAPEPDHWMRRAEGGVLVPADLPAVSKGNVTRLKGRVRGEV